MANFDFENKIWKRGVKYVCGVDEVGRGSFAGPVVAACVGFSSVVVPRDKIKVNDSKLLTQIQRKRAYLWIIDNCITLGVGSANIEEINTLGIVKASLSAMAKAVNNADNYLLKNNIEHLLVDAFFIPGIKSLNKEKQTAIVKGDKLSFSIAAASIVAKVHRDMIMSDLSKLKQYEKYLWDRNKGYGTKEHIKAIREYGLTKHHRKMFVRKVL